MVDTIHPPRRVTIGHITAPVIFDIRLLTGPGVKLAHDLSQCFSLCSRVHRNIQQLTNPGDLPAAVMNLIFGNTAVTVTNRHDFIGDGRTTEEEQHTGQPVFPPA